MLERLFQKIFVAIVPAHNGHDIHTIVTKNKKVLFKEQRHFDGETPSNGMIRYIQETIDPSPYFYISTLNLKNNQGAYIGCSKPAVLMHNQDLVGIQTLCRESAWTQYASQEEIYEIRHHYDSIGIDFIFSPFSMIEYYFADKIKHTLALYAFAMGDIFSIAIFDGGVLEYAHHYSTALKDTIEMEDEITTSLAFAAPANVNEIDDNAINLDDIEELEDLDLLDDLDSLSDIADLDELDEVSEFSEDVLTPEEIRVERERSMGEIKNQIDSSSDEYLRFELIQKTLQRFYQSDECQNRFVETVCIADGGNGGDELKRYLEEELFLNVLVRRVNICEGINALAQLEEENL